MRDTCDTLINIFFNRAVYADLTAVTAKNAENGILYEQTVVDGSRTFTTL